MGIPAARIADSCSEVIQLAKVIGSVQETFSMRRLVVISALVLFYLYSGAAQAHYSKSDSLGAHINYGHGCRACHVSHRCPVKLDRPMLWGQDVISTYGSAWAKEAQLSQAVSNLETTDQGGLLICLSCHDGDYAHQAMMKNVIYEPVPSDMYGQVDPIPTYVDKPGVGLGRDISQHPVGQGAKIGCGGASDWDCLIAQGKVRMAGDRSARFAANYGFFVETHSKAGASFVECTTCHNPHAMNATLVNKDNASTAFASGIYPTRHFLRAPYSPAAAASRTSNQSAQFCRQCHAEMSNEMNDGTAPTTM